MTGVAAQRRGDARTAAKAGAGVAAAGPATNAVAGKQAGGSEPADAAHGDEYSCARAWTALTAAHARITGQLSTALSEACGLSITDFEILLRLGQAAPPGMRLSGLNSAIRLTQPALSRAVARLEQRGYLRRAGTAGDRRGVLITITPAGQETLRQAVPVHARTIRDSLLAPLTPAEQELLGRALARVAAPGWPAGPAAGR